MLVNIIIFGPNGSGKGTQGTLLKDNVLSKLEG